MKDILIIANNGTLTFYDLTQHNKLSLEVPGLNHNFRLMAKRGINQDKRIVKMIVKRIEKKIQLNELD